MPRAHLRAAPRHAGRRRSAKLARLLVAATSVTAAAVGVGVVASGSSGVADTAQLGASAGSVSNDFDIERLRTDRRPSVSRSAKRVTLQPKAVDHRFATERLEVWTAPRENGKRVGRVPWAGRVAVTGQTVGHWAEILVTGERVRWVDANHLAATKPQPEPEPEPEPSSEPAAEDESSTPTAPTGISGAACPDGSAVESGITSSAVRLYRAVCAAFPSLTTYGGYDPHGEHIDGRAIDFMVSGPTGQAVADFVLANASALGVRDIIWAQHIWTPERAGEGWRFMEDRGSTTANHYDHVHVAVY